MSLIGKNKLSEKGIKFALKQLMLMLVMVLICCLFTHLYWGIDYLVSSLLGGLVIIIPNIVFAMKTFKYSGARAAEKVIESFYSGEKIKIVLTAFLIAFAFKFFAILPVPFFTSFCLVVVTPLLTPILFKL